MEGSLDLLGLIEDPETESDGPLWKGADRSVGRGGAMKTGAAKDTEFLFQPERNLRGRKSLQVEG